MPESFEPGLLAVKVSSAANDDETYIITSAFATPVLSWSYDILTVPHWTELSMRLSEDKTRLPTMGMHFNHD